MKPVLSPPVTAPGKAPTGVTGFDKITGRGLPRGRTTLRVGAADVAKPGHA